MAIMNPESAFAPDPFQMATWTPAPKPGEEQPPGEAFA
jgi:hypothetical protein